MDDDFRQASLRKVYYQPKRLVAPSFGFDLVPVLSHSLRARNGALLRDGAVLLTLLVAVIVSAATVVVALAIVVGVQLAKSTYRLARDIVRDLRNGTRVHTATLLPRAILLAIGWSVSWFVFGAGLAFAMGDGDDLDSLSTGSLNSALGLAFLVFLVPVAHALWTQSQLSRLTPGSTVTMPHRNERLDEIGRQQRGNTAVYSGFRPFVGSGPVVETDGFALRLVRPERSFTEALTRHAAAPTEQQREFAEPPFQAYEIIGYLRGHLAGLVPERRAEEQISGFSVEDRICLAGTEVSQLSPETPPEVMAAVVQHPTTPARHYLTCQVFGWGGQLVTTVYVHIAVQGRSLYLEMTTTALPPCAERYRIVDTAEGTEGMAWLRAVKRGLLDTPRIIGRAPANLVGALINIVAGSGNVVGSRMLARGFDYGAQLSVRELGSELVFRNGTELADGVRNLVQVQDVARYQRLIERRVFAAVLDFLDDRDIDTTEYRARAASILNISGGVNNLAGTSTFTGPVAGNDVNIQGAQP
ncbi:hypothetical protein HH310_34050 [Actinoplanes sp. TBRC 11911]|uniref:hypothetical protein n=1 Tax=Actinoplanes sp. TBRC 11911 TaxID=2729386 RepID=UPI00145E0211|nr:hypothetical protein [Actinoplanes sp. TBRC 11911]NMO56189.1 hypothetical protein [Actinoplanes sp. TBRC 11911]